jgi:hypothetical protein
MRAVLKYLCVAVLASVTVAALTAVGCEPKKREQEPEDSPAPAAPIALNDIAPTMTKKSPLHKIPWPSDATPVKGSDGMVATKVGTVQEITAFYPKWMEAQKWKFAPAGSVMDPNDGVKGELGYSTVQNWCKPTKPVTAVSIIVGSGDSTDHGKSAQIIIMKLTGKTSCP